MLASHRHSGQLITREEKPRRLIIASSQSDDARNTLEKLRPILEEARRPKAVVLVEYDPDDLPQEKIDALVKSSLEEMPKPSLILFMGGPEIAKLVDGYKGNLPSRTRYLVHGGRKDDLRKIVQTVEYLKTWAPMRDKLTWTGVNAKLTPPEGVTALTTEEAAAWDAAWLAACAVVMTGDGSGKVDAARLTRGDPLVVGPKSWPSVREALEKGESVDLDGASGPLTLNAGVAMEDIGLWRVDRGDGDELVFLQIGVYTTGRKGPRWTLDD